MESTLEKALLKKTPCNECRKRKRKCSYEQPCERCKKLDIECSYTVIASPIDLEYMQELEYVKQVEDLEAQIRMMENELNTFKLAQDKSDLKKTQQVEDEKENDPEKKTDSDREEQVQANHLNVPPPITDYPSPVSMDFRTGTPSPKLPELSLKSQLHFKPYGHRHHDHSLHSPKVYPNPDHHHDHCHGFRSKNKYGGRKGHIHHLLAKSGKVKVFLSPQEKEEEEERNKKEEQSWVLTVNKEGGMTINTFITSHAELLHNLNDVLHTIDGPNPIHNRPIRLSPSANSYITSAITSFLWKSYGKQRIKNMTKEFRIEYNKTAVVQVSNVQNLMFITLQIIHAYMNCLHLQHFFLHMPSFLANYINAYSLNNVLESPAVMALCSTLCLLPCKHITAHIPSGARSDYALYYFEQARELISEKFDDMTLETMMTFSFMAYHKLKLREYDACINYIDMAKRIHAGLEPADERSNDFIQLQRMTRCIRYVSDTAFLLDMMDRGAMHRYGGRHNFTNLLKVNEVIPVLPSDQDTAQEKEFILMIQCKAMLQHKLHTALTNEPLSNTLPSCVGEFSHQMEMALRDWYRHQLPERFQLPLPLFEDSLSDLEFFTTLEKECGNAQKLLCTMTVYNEYLVMAKAYVPKNPNDDFPSVQDLIARFNVLEAKHQFNDPLPPPRTTVRWEKFLYRIIHFNRFHQPPGAEYEGTEEDYLRELLESVHMEDMNFDMPVARTSIIAALNLVRLVQFLTTRDYVCYLDDKWLKNAWDILVRASRFKYDSEGITLQRIRANMLMCMNIIKQHPMYDKVKGVQETLLKLQMEFDDCIA